MSDTDNESFFEQASEGDLMVTPNRTITEADVVNFAGVSGDFNYLHTDAETMADTEFGERIVHGTFVLSAGTGLIWQTRSDLEKRCVVAFYGIDRLRFVNPMFIGDTMHVEREIENMEERDHPEASGTVRYDVKIKNQDDEVIISCEMLSMVR